jgi:transcriptional regulator with XRE-family HTH domain
VTFDEILDAINKSGWPEPGEEQVPSPEIIAFFVRYVRDLRQWKKHTLASFAGVSLSTVERVERAETVSDDCLDRIAVGLGYDKGYFTKPRVALSPGATAEKIEETWGNLIVVPVRRLSTQRAIRQLGRCHGFLLHRPGVVDAIDDLIQELAEWLDLASFILGSPDDLAPPTEGRRRELYADILDCVLRIEQHGLYVLGGIMDAPQLGIDDWKVAVVSITPKRDDPGAPKRRALYVDRRCAELPASWQAAF